MYRCNGFFFSPRHESYLKIEEDFFLINDLIRFFSVDWNAMLQIGFAFFLNIASGTSAAQWKLPTIISCFDFGAADWLSDDKI